MDKLPKDVLDNVVGFLSPFSAVRLNTTSKTLRSQLPLSISVPRAIPTTPSKSDFALSYPSAFESAGRDRVILWLSWKCAGHARQGQVSVVARKGRKAQERTLFSTAADLRARRRHLRVAFRPGRDASHLLRVGACGSWEYHVFRTNVQTLSFVGSPRLGKVHRYVVEVAACVSSRLIDAAMGNAGETDLFWGIPNGWQETDGDDDGCSSPAGGAQFSWERYGGVSSLDCRGVEHRHHISSVLDDVARTKDGESVSSAGSRGSHGSTGSMGVVRRLFLRESRESVASVGAILSGSAHSLGSRGPVGLFD